MRNDKFIKYIILIFFIPLLSCSKLDVKEDIVTISNEKISEINSTVFLEGKVIKIKDGDTVTILTSNNQEIVIRVADIDCPELSQPFGNKSKIFTSNEIFSKNVEIEIKNTDRFDRVVGFILYDNKNLSYELLKNGLAWHYKFFSDNEEMAIIEQKAKENKIGLWIDKNPINPYEWRKGKRN